MAATCNGDTFVDKISRTECVGNSLNKINKNFAALDQAICRSNNSIDDIKLTNSSNLLPWVVNCRLSLHETDPEPRNDIKEAQILYLHPYKGSSVSLWNVAAKRWELLPFKRVISQQIECEADSNYDVFLYHDGFNFFLELDKWGEHEPGKTPPTLEEQNGVRVKASDFGKRLIGCLRSTVEGQTEMSFGKTAVEGGSHPKLFLWNAYNQIPFDFSILDAGSTGRSTWTTTTSGDNAQNEGPFEKLNASSNNKISFISRDSTNISLNSIHTSENAAQIYFIHSLNRETPTITEFLEETPGKPLYETYSNHTINHTSQHIIRPGYHYFQLSTLTYANEPVVLNLWKGNRHSFGTTGLVTHF